MAWWTYPRKIIRFLLCFEVFLSCRRFFTTPGWKQKMLVVTGKLIRTKDPELPDPTEEKSKTKLMKVLTTIDLTSLGIGSCVGTGMYLVAGMVAHKVAGPAVVLSFVVAAVASLFSGVCYAEFGVRVPHTTGSAYMYSYVTVGEFIAFVIGWNMVLEYLIGTAAGACAISACIDAMSGGAISGAITSQFGVFLDFLAMFITFLMTLLMIAGVKKSLFFTNVLNTINLSVWVFIMTAGFFYVDSNNWAKHGGFMPFGWTGVLSGAATCFYAFIGFDIIATTGEEAKNPTKSIPMAVILSLIIVLTAYITSSMMLTLIVPFEDIDPESALVEMFAAKGAYKAKYVVAIGALAGLVVSMFGSMFPMPRIVYAMAKDGLIHRSLSKVWPLTGTPAAATTVLGIATAIVSLVMSLDVLVEMMSIGTLMAYTLVSTCVLLLRYQPPKTTLIQLLPESIRSACPTPSKEAPPPAFSSSSSTTIKTKTIHTKRTNRYDSSDSDESPSRLHPEGIPIRQDHLGDDTHGNLGDGNLDTSYGALPPPPPPGATEQGPAPYADFFTIPNMYLKKALRFLPYHWINPSEASSETGIFVMKAVGILYLLIFIMDLILVCAMPGIEHGNGAAIFFLLLFLLAIIFCIYIIAQQPQTKCDLKFKAPFVPVVPAIAIIVNIYLMFKLSVLTLVRFTIWMILGLRMYFWYGIKHSSLEQEELENPLELKIPEDRTGNEYQLEERLADVDDTTYGTAAKQGSLVSPTNGYVATYQPTHQPAEEYPGQAWDLPPENTGSYR